MKYFSFCCFAGLLGAGVVDAVAIDCKRHVSQERGLGTNSTSISASSTISATTTISTTSPFLADSVLSHYLPIFFEDFTGLPNTLPSTTNWLFDTGTSYPGGSPNWGNSEKEIYTTSLQNIHLTHSSTLLITPLITSTHNWTSARIETARDDFQCPPNGKLFIQASIKLGSDPESLQQGIWPAFWALGSAFRGNYTNWPGVSEWDIMESVNGLSTNMMTIHCGTAPDGPCNEYNGISSKTNFTRGIFNTFGFEIDRTKSDWTEETLTWYLNGEEQFVVTGEEVGDEDAWKALAHDEHFLLLNVAVGGTVPDVYSSNGTSTPTGETRGGRGSAMEVDYVGVWVAGLLGY